MRAGILLLGLSLAACSNKGLIIDQQKEQIDFLNEENEMLQQRIQELGESAESASNAWEVVGTLVVDSCFVENTARLNLEGVRQMEEVAVRLRHAFDGSFVRIEGYSGHQILSDELKDSYPSTWELTSARASMIARHLQWTHEFEPSQMEVVGYGHYRTPGEDVTAGSVVRILAVK